MKDLIKTKVETYRIDKKCIKCKDGLMYSTGKAISQWHINYEHCCDKCQHIHWYEDERFPKYEYKDVLNESM